MEDTLTRQVAQNLGMDASEVSSVIDEFMLLLHKEIYEYKGIDGNYVSEELHWKISPQAFFHLLGFIYEVGYDTREKGMANELLLRLGSRADWLPYRHQMEGWKNPSVRKQILS